MTGNDLYLTEEKIMSGEITDSTNETDEQATYIANQNYSSDGVDPHCVALKQVTATVGEKGFYHELSINPTHLQGQSDNSKYRFCLREVNKPDLRHPYGTALNSVEMHSITQVLKLAVMPVFSCIKWGDSMSKKIRGMTTGERDGHRAIASVVWLNFPLGTTVWLNKNALCSVYPEKDVDENFQEIYINDWRKVICDHGYGFGLYNPQAPCSSHTCCDSNPLEVRSCSSDKPFCNNVKSLVIPESAKQQPIYMAVAERK